MVNRLPFRRQPEETHFGGPRHAGVSRHSRTPEIVVLLLAPPETQQGTHGTLNKNSTPIPFYPFAHRFGRVVAHVLHLLQVAQGFLPAALRIAGLHGMAEGPLVRSHLRLAWLGGDDGTGVKQNSLQTLRQK